MPLALEVLDVKRCPHVVENDGTYECGVLHRSSARDVCDPESLQRWCLHPEDHIKCVFYRGRLKEKPKLVFG